MPALVEVAPGPQGALLPAQRRGPGRRARRARQEGPEAAMTERPPLLEAEGLVKAFPIKGGAFGRVSGHVRAVDGVDLDVGTGEALGLVGESGCGKTHARAPAPAADRARRRHDHLRRRGPAGAPRATSCGASAASCRSCSRIPSPRSTPGPPSATPSARGSGSRASTGAERDAAGRRGARRWSGWSPYHARRYPASVQRRPAPAHRDRPSTGGRARGCWWPTSRSRPSTSRSSRRSSTCCATCSAASSWRWCSWPTT